MGHFKDTTVEITFKGKKYRVSKGVAEALKRTPANTEKKKIAKKKDKNK